MHKLDQPGTKEIAIQFNNTPSRDTLLKQDSIVLMPHIEDNYTDFYYERNLPYLLSKEGPQVAVADVNGDKLDDMYIGGAKGQAGQLYIQNNRGGFVNDEQSIFKEYADFEDVAVLFFDADKDGDADLFYWRWWQYWQAK